MAKKKDKKEKKEKKLKKASKAVEQVKYVDIDAKPAAAVKAAAEEPKAEKKSASTGAKHPGSILSDYMLVNGLTVAKTAELLHSSRQSVNELAHERRACSAEMALKLAKLFGTDAKFWMNMQRDVDLAEAEKKCAEAVSEILPLN